MQVTKTFPITADTMVLTSTFVTVDGMPILEICHDDDEEGGSLWQFHCGNGDYENRKLQLVRLDTILNIDPSVTQIADLKMCETARRETPDSPWVIVK